MPVRLWAMVTDGDVVAEETAVCDEHRGDGADPAYDDVSRRELVDCSENSRLSCTVCGAR